MSLTITNARLTDGSLADIELRGETIYAIRPLDARASAPSAPSGEILDARGRLLIPGFVDCHTHACWSDADGAHRLDEWEMRCAGVEYLDILKRGGGIMASVRAVRAAPQEALTGQLVDRLKVLLRNGTTTVEVKSGYGLVADHEIKMIRAIRDAGKLFGGTLIPTALLGHAIDPDVPRDRFIAQTIDQTLPRVHEEFPGIAVDAFCEKGAWTVEECTRLFEAAQRLGHPVRVHADQFNSLGMTPKAAAMGALSVDHLEASTAADFSALAASRTFAVALPACGHHLDGRYADLRPLRSCADRICIASNLNPGSAPCWSMVQVIGLAVRHCGLDASEAMAAASVNPARLLGFADRARIAPGYRADLLLTRHQNIRALAFNFGDSGIDEVIVGGRPIC